MLVGFACGLLLLRSFLALLRLSWLPLVPLALLSAGPLAPALTLRSVVASLAGAWSFRLASLVCLPFALVGRGSWPRLVSGLSLSPVAGALAWHPVLRSLFSFCVRLLVLLPSHVLGRSGSPPANRRGLVESHLPHVFRPCLPPGPSSPSPLRPLFLPHTAFSAVVTFIRSSSASSRSTRRPRLRHVPAACPGPSGCSCVPCSRPAALSPARLRLSAAVCPLPSDCPRLPLAPPAPVRSRTVSIWYVLPPVSLCW